MNKLLARFCLLLAGSDFSNGEIAKMLNEFRNSGLQQVLDDVEFLRASAERRALSRSEDENLTLLAAVSDGDFGAVDRVVALLRDEAHMSTREAIEVLSAALRERFPKLREPEALPPLGKKSLGIWVARVSRLVPPRELLHLATVIRNQRVHQTSSDWTIKR